MYNVSVKQKALHPFRFRKDCARMDAGIKRDTYCHLLDQYGPVLSGRCQDVLELYYEADLSLSEIAENCGITRQGVHDAIRRGEADLVQWEQKLHFAAKCEQILKLAEEMKKRFDDPEIRRLSDEIAGVITRETEENVDGDVL